MELSSTTQLLLSSVPIEQLAELFRSIVKEELHAKAQAEAQERFLSPKETCELFFPKISLVTLNNWTNKGLLTKHHISGRTYYRQCEVIEAVKSLKKYKC